LCFVAGQSFSTIEKSAEVHLWVHTVKVLQVLQCAAFVCVGPSLQSRRPTGCLNNDFELCKNHKAKGKSKVRPTTSHEGTER